MKVFEGNFLSKIMLYPTEEFDCTHKIQLCTCAHSKEMADVANSSVRKSSPSVPAASCLKELNFKL